MLNTLWPISNSIKLVGPALWSRYRFFTALRDAHS